MATSEQGASGDAAGAAAALELCPAPNGSDALTGVTPEAVAGVEGQLQVQAGGREQEPAHDTSAVAASAGEIPWHLAACASCACSECA